MDAALHAAVCRDDLTAAEHCLVAGARPAAVDHGGWSALHVAACLGLAAMAHGATVDARTDVGSTPLHFADSAEYCRVLKSSCIPLLLAAGADPRCRDFDGLTPADVARRRGRLAAAALLEDAAAACERWSGLRAAAITAWCSPGGAVPTASSPPVGSAAA